MAKQYQWRTASAIISGGYQGEETGVINGNQDWTTTETMSGSTTEEYFYRDSNVPNNANSSRVVVSITENWTASINSRNYLTVTLSTIVNSIRRDDIRGAPGAIGRNIFIRREDGGSVLWSTSNDSINTAHTILSTPIVLDDYSFTLAPGENLERGSIFFRNNVPGYDNVPVPPPNENVDLMWLGTAFRNILPKDYRPGKVWNGSDWMSHNRGSGASNIRGNSSNWIEMRTNDGASGQDNPPYMRHQSVWYNMRQIGTE